MSYRDYLGKLCRYVLSSSVLLGIILGVANLIAAESTANIDLEFDLGGPGGLWLIPGLPLSALLVFVILSPLSFQVHKLLSKKGADKATADA